MAEGDGVGLKRETPWCEPAGHTGTFDRRGRLLSGGPWSMLIYVLHKRQVKERQWKKVGSRW